MTTRRNFLAASSSALFATWMTGCGGRVGADTRPKIARNGKDLKFVFVVAEGGWDVTRVFAPEFGNPNVSMEANSERDSEGRLDFVSNPGREVVTDFFKRHGRNSLIVNGILVPSLAHDVCTKLVMTGSTADGRADMPAFIANASARDFALPHIVLSGPSFAGDLGTVVTRVNSGRLGSLLDGSVVDSSELLRADGSEVVRLDSAVEGIIDRHLQQRMETRLKVRRLAAQVERLNGIYASAIDRAKAIKDLQAEVNFSAGGDLSQRMEFAVEMLSRGVSRCATVSIGGWDTHSDNDRQQNDRFTGLFEGLTTLADLLESTPGQKESRLSDETVVVVVSEMARTPLLNGSNGKDHWAYSSALLFGPGIASNRVIGAFDENFNGAPVDFRSGDVTDRGETLGSNNFCAAVLNIAGIDHRSLMPGVASFPAMVG